ECGVTYLKMEQNIGARRRDIRRDINSCAHGWLVLAGCCAGCRSWARGVPMDLTGWTALLIL
ncbi:hypothetical protein A2U01_0118700, partial [Trifolium medium]|nr:hypothetical protein [Trifolium medium]